MNILLVTPYMAQHFDAGIFFLRAFQQLGHTVWLWDYRLDPDPPADWFDIDLSPNVVVVMKGENIDPRRFRAEHDSMDFVCCYWPDAFTRNPGIEEKLHQYDKVFTSVCPTPSWATWLPSGFDPDIHRDLGLPHTAVKTMYVGTNNSDYKRDMVRAIAPSAVYGNGWGHFKDNCSGPVYLHDFVRVANQAKILLDIHHDPAFGLNRKFFECCAMGFTLMDRVPGVVELLGMSLASACSFTSASQAKEFIDFYLRNPKACEDLWLQERRAIQPYSYLECAKKILSYLK